MKHPDISFRLATSLYGKLIQEAKCVLKKMADVNQRPPFLFRLNAEIEEANSRFFCLKKEDLQSMNSLATPKMDAGAKKEKKNDNSKLQELISHKKKDFNMYTSL